MTGALETRIGDAFGSDGVAILATAMRCTRERFKYQKPRSIVVAVLELIETAKANRVAAHSWPRRWHSEGGVTVATGDEIQQRFERLFGQDSLIARLACAVGMSCGGVRAVLASTAGRGIDDLQTVVELIELLDLNAVPRSAWPPRWRMVEKRRHKPGQNRATVQPGAGAIVTRIGTLFPRKFPSASFARALERTPDSLSRVWRGERDSQGRVAVLQPEIVAIVELLETLQAEGVPVERWPARWRNAIEPASRASSNRGTDASDHCALSV